mgnify:CR=1 FL=1
MMVGTPDNIKKVILNRAYEGPNTGMKVKPSVEVTFAQGPGFYIVLDNNEDAEDHYKYFLSLKNIQKEETNG